MNTSGIYYDNIHFGIIDTKDNYYLLHMTNLVATGAHLGRMIMNVCMVMAQEYNIKIDKGYLSKLTVMIYTDLQCFVSSHKNPNGTLGFVF